MRMRIEFWERNGKFGVTIRIGMLGFAIPEQQNRELYEFLSKSLENAPHKMEYPADDSGIEVVTFETLA